MSKTSTAVFALLIKVNFGAKLLSDVVGGLMLSGVVKDLKIG